MINIDKIKEKIADKEINSYVESYLAISNQLENLQDEWIEGNLNDKEYDSILDMQGYLAYKITNYYIDNYYLS